MKPSQQESKRPYVSPLRVEQRRETRARVVLAAGEAFAEWGFVATTMQAIAEIAGVSVDTVYLNGSKRELLFAALETAVAGGEGSQSVLERPWVKELLAEPDLDRLLSRLAAATGDGHARDARIFAALADAAAADEEVGRAYRELVGRMRSDTATVAAILDERRGAIRGLPVEELGDTFWLLTHPDGYRRLVEEAGWSTERYVGWLEQMLRYAVLGASSGPRREDHDGEHLVPPNPLRPLDQADVASPLLDLLSSLADPDAAGEDS